MARKLASSKKPILILFVPTAIYCAYSLLRNDLTGLIVALSSFTAFSSLIYYYFRRKSLPTKIDEQLVSLILHLYAISHGEVSPDDLINSVADNDEYGQYCKVFRKIRQLAKEFGYGFTKATSQIAATVKPPLKDVLVRFTETFSTTNPKGYLELEASTITEEYSGYYLRSIESIKVLGGIFSTFQSVAVFIILTLDILTVFMAEQEVVYYSYVIAICAISVMFLGLRAVTPKDVLVHMNKEEPPKLYRIFKLCLPITVACVAPAAVIFMMVGPAYGLIFLGSVLLLPGFLAYKLENFVYNVDEHYPAFIKSLGEKMASTSSLKSALSYVLYMELGPLKTLLRRALARVKMGVSNEKSLAMLSSEASSHRVHITNKIFVDAVNLGSDPLEVGKILGNNCVKFLEFRKRRMSVARSFQVVLVVLQPITVVLLVVLTFLCRFFSRSLTSLPYFTFGEIPLGVIEVGNIVMVLFITAVNALGAQETKGGFWGTTLLYAAILLVLSGAAWLVADKFLELTLGQLLEGFEITV